MAKRPDERLLPMAAGATSQETCRGLRRKGNLGTQAITQRDHCRSTPVQIEIFAVTTRISRIGCDAPITQFWASLSPWQQSADYVVARICGRCLARRLGRL